jgi:hypothetical protein
MITKFETGSPVGKSSNTLLIVLGLAVAGYLVYRFVIKPNQDKAKQDKAKQDNQE